MSAIAKPASLTTPTGLDLAGRELTFDEWRELGVRLGRVANSTTWNLADWVLYGVETIPKGRRYTEALELTGYQYGSLALLASVARRFPLERRRRDLTFEHHRTVAPLPEREQELFLDRATELGWSTRRLREAVQSASRREARRSSSTTSASSPRTMPTSASANGRKPTPAAARDDEARRVAERAGREYGEAYRFAAYVAECELTDGRGSEPVYEAATAFCGALEESVELTADVDARSGALNAESSPALS